MEATQSEVPVASTSAPVSPAGPQLRLWPALVVVVLQWLGYMLPGLLAPGTMAKFMGMLWSSLGGAGLLAVWWLFFSRLRWVDRLVGLAVLALTGAGASLLYHETVGAMGLVLFALPVVTTAWVLWLAVSKTLTWPVRRLCMYGVFAAAWGYFALLRLEGLDGSFESETSFRWAPTKEEEFLAAQQPPAAGRQEPPKPEVARVLEAQAGDWPCFRGPTRDSRVPGVSIATNWKAQPPKEVWRKRIGPGWSSFSVVGGRLYTQEQRSQEEAVVCYAADTGAELWAHRDTARFTEVVAGPGPRATPTFHEGKLFTLGATGRLNCLDAMTGAPIWAADIARDADAKVPMWGFSSSPLVARGVVSVFAGGSGGKSVLGYEAATGKLLWSGGTGALGYCSTQLSKLGGVELVTISTDDGLFGFEPASGKELWKYAWPSKGVARVVQPAAVGDSDLLIGTGFGLGLRRVRIAQENNAWSAKETWATKAISPYFNDFVVHKDHVYGFTTTLLVCVSLDDGKERWRANGYANGQVLLLPDQDLMLVLTEKGEVGLVDARPDGHKELAKFKMLDGKTWNHPVLVHGKLYVRNGAEAACYQLAVAAP